MTTPPLPAARRRRQVRVLRRLPADAPRPRGPAPADRPSGSSWSSSPRRPRCARTGPYDVLLVEGSISAPDQVEEIVRLRSRTRLLVTIGACATSGGIQALRNWADEPHGARPSTRRRIRRSLATRTPITDHVQVDAELRGCPIDPGQLLELLTALRVGRRPQLPDESVCLECKRRGNPCVLVAGERPASAR